MLKSNPTIILRMTNACNLNCKYCYDKNNHCNNQSEDSKFKNNLDEIVKNIETLLYNKNSKCKIIFHGGEPLLIKPDTYEKLN